MSLAPAVTKSAGRSATSKTEFIYMSLLLSSSTRASSNLLCLWLFVPASSPSLLPSPPPVLSSAPLPLLSMGWGFDLGDEEDTHKCLFAEVTMCCSCHVLKGREDIWSLQKFSSASRTNEDSGSEFPHRCLKSTALNTYLGQYWPWYLPLSFLFGLVLFFSFPDSNFLLNSASQSRSGLVSRVDCGFGFVFFCTAQSLIVKWKFQFTSAKQLPLLYWRLEFY